MKPIYHPAVSDITVEGILYAFSDPVRVHIYAEIQSSECPQICSNFLKIGNRELPKSSLSQHFKILREAGLIRTERKGVEMHNTTRCEELNERFGGMIQAIINTYSEQFKKQKSKKR
jgi:DNA-binding transcriptional ArsR family regulator